MNRNLTAETFFLLSALVGIMVDRHKLENLRRTLTRDAVFSLLAGLALLGLSSRATHTPEGSYGAPLTYAVPILICGTLNPLNGCGFSYNLGAIGADYLFWTALAFGLVFLFDTSLTRVRTRRGYRSGQQLGSTKPVGDLEHSNWHEPPLRPVVSPCPPLGRALSGRLLSS